MSCDRTIIEMFNQHINDKLVAPLEARQFLNKRMFTVSIHYTIRAIGLD